MSTTCKIIATYENPDLDGFACAYAYSELLNKQNKNSLFVLFGEYQIEVEFLLLKHKISAPANSNNFDIKDNPIALVDTSSLTGLSKKIDPKNVVEVIDHRMLFQQKDFPNATFHVELVGAAATLIAEKYKNSSTSISYESAVLLYYAIVSNTINFKANVTTIKDIEISNWLFKIINPPPDEINQIFQYKTQNIIVSKDFLLNSYSSFFNFNNISIGIIQLEINNAHEFLVKNNMLLIKILEEIKLEFSLDIIFITTIDLMEGNNYFFTQFNKSQLILEKDMSISFNGAIAKRNGVIMRKEIVPILKKSIESL